MILKKNDTLLFGHKIIHPEFFIKQSSEYKILITSMFFTEIAEQMLNQGMIKSISEVMVFDGQLEAEALFCGAFEKLMKR